MMKRLLCVLLTVLVVLLPMAAIAQGETHQRFTLSNPVFEMRDSASDPSTLDLKGLKLALDSSNAGFIAQVLADDAVALSVAGQMKEDDLLLWAEGLSKVISMKRDAIDLAESVMTETPTIDPSALLASLEGVTLTPAGREEVLFLDATQKVEAEKITLHAADAQIDAFLTSYKAIAEQAGEVLTDIDFEDLLAADMTLDASFWISDDTTNTRLEIVFTRADEKDTTTINGAFLMAQPGGDVLKLYGTLGRGTQQFELSLTVQPDEVLADYPQFAGQLIERKEDAVQMTLTLNIKPESLEDGINHLINVSLELANGQTYDLTAGRQHTTSTASDLYALDLSSNQGFSGYVYCRQVPVEADGITGTDGALEISFTFDGKTILATADLSAHTMPDALVLPDISAMPVIDFNNITEEDMTQLMSEGQMMMLRALGSLMTLPGLEAMASAMM
ncbi:MAG: hypothetical protein RSJ41_06530 [Clostridia bacterium]